MPRVAHGKYKLPAVVLLTMCGTHTHTHITQCKSVHHPIHLPNGCLNNNYTIGIF